MADKTAYLPLYQAYMREFTGLIHEAELLIRRVNDNMWSTKNGVLCTYPWSMEIPYFHHSRVHVYFLRLLKAPMANQPNAYKNTLWGSVTEDIGTGESSIGLSEKGVN